MNILCFFLLNIWAGGEWIVWWQLRYDSTRKYLSKRCVCVRGNVKWNELIMCSLHWRLAKSITCCLFLAYIQHFDLSIRYTVEYLYSTYMWWLTDEWFDSFRLNSIQWYRDLTFKRNLGMKCYFEILIFFPASIRY